MTRITEVKDPVSVTIRLLDKVRGFLVDDKNEDVAIEVYTVLKEELDYLDGDDTFGTEGWNPENEFPSI